jgi:dTDP-4-dehydrorhamnose 3,5-epimerase
MIYIPAGFAHGFQTLAENAELLYHHSAFYNATAEAGLRYDDPGIGISWPLPVTLVSERDQNHPYIDEKFKGY